MYVMKKHYENKIREIEYDILDNEFKKYELITYKNQVSIPYLLKAYGDLMRELKSQRFAMRSEFALWKALGGFSDGLTHCLKWVINNPGKEVAEELNYEEKHERALDFLVFGKQYHSVAQHYIAWSRKMINVKLNENQRDIEFAAPGAKECYFGLSQDISLRIKMDKYVESFPDKMLKKYYSNWLTELDLSEYLINVDWKKAKSAVILDEIKTFFSLYMLPELDGITDLGGYSLDDFIHFYSCLYITFDFITSVEDYIDLQTNFENPFGSTPFIIPKNEVTEFFMEMTDLSSEIVNSIINDIKLDTKKFHSKIFSQPLIEAGNNFYILPRIFNRIYPNALIPNILTKGTKTDLYSRLINTIEKNNLNKIKAQIEKGKIFDFELKKESNFVSGNKLITPDFVLIDNKNHELLVIDYKHFLSSFSAVDTYNRLNEIKKGIKQIRKYIDFFNNLNSAKKRSNYSCYGMLLFHNPMVLPFKIPEEENITVTDINTFFNYFNKSTSIFGLNSSISQLSDLDIKIEACFHDEESVNVGGWTFKWKIFAAN